uniref:Arrestin C-terminal-like domain-containing protein n=1 Tax=Scleropages formosus TaxID=113540 RepID=A0A8C9R4Z2_SCLFO
MPSPVRFCLLYNVINEQNTFRCGDVLGGKVILQLTKDTKVQELVIKVRGRAKVHWEVQSIGVNDTYSAKDEYFRLDHILLRPSNAEGSVALSAGSHMYPFKFRLPKEDIPSSFKGSHGSIKYTLKVILRRSWRLPIIDDVEIIFQSKAGVSSPRLMTPHYGSVEKKFSVFTSGRVSMNARLDKKAYMPGEAMKITVETDNCSSRELAVKISLEQVQLYFAEGETKTSTTRVAKWMLKPVPTNTQQSLTEMLTIPHDLPLSFFNCSIIRLHYVLKVYMDVPYAADPWIGFPLVIVSEDCARTLATKPDIPTPFGAVGNGSENSDPSSSESCPLDGAPDMLPLHSSSSTPPAFNSFGQCPPLLCNAADPFPPQTCPEESQSDYQECPCTPQIEPKTHPVEGVFEYCSSLTDSEGKEPQ